MVRFGSRLVVCLEGCAEAACEGIQHSAWHAQMLCTVHWPVSCDRLSASKAAACISSSLVILGDGVVVCSSLQALKAGTTMMQHD